MIYFRISHASPLQECDVTSALTSSFFTSLAQLSWFQYLTSLLLSPPRPPHPCPYFSLRPQAEARLAAKRAARAEAREIRMKELERQQKEVRRKIKSLLQGDEEEE